MLSADKDAFQCDIAETYHIVDYKALPVGTLAVLASGLRTNSRIRMKMAGYRYIMPELILAQIYDLLVMVSTKKEDRPARLTDLMTGKTEPAKKETQGFNSGAEFEAYRQMIFERAKHG